MSVRGKQVLFSTACIASLWALSTAVASEDVSSVGHCCFEHGHIQNVMSIAESFMVVAICLQAKLHRITFDGRIFYYI